MKIFGFCIVIFLVFNTGCANPPALPAFPGAEGAGMWSVGGRGGKVYEVTNLNDNDPGSLREAVETSGPRIVVFRVSGNIELLSPLVIENPYITIAGQTAPGGGICLKNRNFEVSADHVIVRHIRFRLGGNKQAIDDSVSIKKGRNIIIDHCSASWGGDETLSVTASDNILGNVTVQWCMITESLNYRDHGYGSLIRGCFGNVYTFHHNLYAHHHGRNPRPGNNNDYIADPDGLIFDFRNNVLYNWGGSYAGYNADKNSVTKINFVGNYYIQGPNSTDDFAFREGCPYSRAYFSDNWMNGSCPKDPWSLVKYDGLSEAQKAAYKQSSQFPVESEVTMDNAPTAYKKILANAGATLPKRDAVDVRIIKDIVNGTGNIINVENEVNGWPVLASGTPPADADHDGMPDEWEKERGLDPTDAGDSKKDRDNDGYTNIEEYINGLCFF